MKRETSESESLLSVIQYSVGIPRRVHQSVTSEVFCVSFRLIGGTLTRTSSKREGQFGVLLSSGPSLELTSKRSLALGLGGSIGRRPKD